jgi:hypothetical protein
MSDPLLELVGQALAGIAAVDPKAAVGKQRQRGKKSKPRRQAQFTAVQQMVAVQELQLRFLTMRPTLSPAAAALLDEWLESASSARLP